MTASQHMSASEKSDHTALLGVVLAAAIAVFVEPEAWDWTDCALGVTLLLILHAYDRERDTSWLKLLTFGAVFGMCSMVATGVFWERLLKTAGRDAPRVSTEIESRLEDYETALIWLIFGVVGTVWAGFKRGK